jgi:hypothetical protein
VSWCWWEARAACVRAARRQGEAVCTPSTLPAGGATGCPGAVVVLAAWKWHTVRGFRLHELRVWALLGGKVIVCAVRAGEPVDCKCAFSGYWQIVWAVPGMHCVACIAWGASCIQDHSPWRCTALLQGLVQGFVLLAPDQAFDSPAAESVHMSWNER